MKKFNTYIIALMMTLLMVTPTVTLAVGGTTPVQTQKDIDTSKEINKIFKIEDIDKNETTALEKLAGQVKSNKEASFSDVFAGIINVLTGVAVVMTFVGAIVAGLFLLFSNGEEDRQTKAKTILIYIAIGDVIIAASYAIVRAITLIKPLS